MQKRLLSLALTLPLFLHAEVLEKKVIDEGGTGDFSAVAVTESSLPDYVVYRPEKLNKAGHKESGFPVMVFANGGCNDTSLPFEHMLSEIASHGYLVVALGSMQHELTDRELHKSPNEQMPQAIDWLEKQNQNTDSTYYHTANLAKIAFAGQSCGGAQVLAEAGDTRVSSYLMFNSGIGDMTMAAANQQSLASLHAPVLYLIGGESDVAYQNALLDYERITQVPVSFANDIDGGHSGTFEQPYGGSFAQMALAWLDWQLKSDDSKSAIFLKQDVAEFPGWTVKTKQF